MQLRLGLTLALSALSLAGCSTFGISNGSLDYKDATNLKPLKYPEGAMVRPATPLYPAPIVDDLALKHAPNFENERGNRYEAPRPDIKQSNVEKVTESAASDTVNHPQLLTDGNGNPLIKIDGNSDTIWKYTLATLSSLNLKVSEQSKNANQAVVKIDNQNYVIKLTPVGSSNTIAVFKTDNTFADKEKSAELLTQIYQNWPA